MSTIDDRYYAKDGQHQRLGNELIKPEREVRTPALVAIISHSQSPLHVKAFDMTYGFYENSGSTPGKSCISWIFTFAQHSSWKKNYHLWPRTGSFLKLIARR
jgi:hypothetical protein